MNQAFWEGFEKEAASDKERDRVVNFHRALGGALGGVAGAASGYGADRSLLGGIIGGGMGMYMGRGIGGLTGHASDAIASPLGDYVDSESPELTREMFNRISPLVALGAIEAARTGGSPGKALVKGILSNAALSSAVGGGVRLIKSREH